MKIKYNGAIKASSDGNEDIVMYWDDRKVYEGPVDSDMTRKIAWFLDDPEKLQEIVDYCNSFGDPVIEDTSDLMDVAATFVEMVGYELREAESIDDVYVSDEAGHFEIFEKSKEVTGAKKSVKAAEQDGNCDKSFKMQGTTYCIEMINDGGSYVAKWWDSSDNGLGYNNKGWVALNNDFGRNTGKFSSENIESLLGVISEYDRKPGKPVQDRIKREVAKLINLNSINSATNYNSIADIKAATDITNLKILIDNVGYVEVYEDGYETGEGKYVNAWDFDISGTYDSMQEVVDAISNQVGTSKDIKDYVYIDGRIDTDMEQNAEGLSPTDAEYEAWKRGEETLYVAHILVYLKVGAEVHDMTEDEAEAFGLPLY